MGAIPIDSDGDGEADTTDNCPSIPNPDQANFDEDSQGNACDSDDDDDGIPDAFEEANGLNTLNRADASGDLDGDGFTNLQEFHSGTDPNDPTSSAATAIFAHPAIIAGALADAFAQPWRSQPYG